MNCYVGQVYWPRVLVFDLVYKGRVTLIVIHSLREIILVRFLFLALFFFGIFSIG